VWRFFIEEKSMKKILCAGLLALLAATPAFAEDVKVSDAWARATAPGQDSAMVQLVITSKKAGALVAGASKIAQTVEIHTMVMEGDVMKMRQVDAVELPAGKAVDLGAAGYHLMLIGLKKPLKEGTMSEIVLTVRFAGGKEEKVNVQAEIKPLTESGHHEHMHH
jgi:copper(I)-binding protein